MIRAGLVTQALEEFDRAEHEEEIDLAEGQRAELIARFPPERWFDLELEDYALGQADNEENFCRWMEFRATELGSIRGGSARKHHIYRQQDSGEWWFERDRYETVEEAWEAVRGGFIDAIRLVKVDGRWEQIDAIPALRGGPALLAKTLHLYFPDEVLPVCSHAHLTHFLTALGEDRAALSDLGTIGLNRLLLAGLRESGELPGWTTKEMERLLYGSGLSPANQAPHGGPLPDIPGFIASVVAEYGDAAIEARRGAEDKAREILDAGAAGLGEGRLRELMRLFNVDFHKGKESKSRFSPAFVGATANRLAENLDEVNRWIDFFWDGDEDVAFDNLDRLLEDHTLLPAAGTSFPTMLFYLRDPERFAVWLQPTDRGLQRLYPSYQPRSSPGAGNLDDYFAFSRAATDLMRDYEIPPELLDAVLAAASRVVLDDAEAEEDQADASIWIFQANPDLYDIDTAISEEERILWAVRQYRTRVRKGDRVYLWRAGAEAGVIATARVVGEPAERVDPLVAKYARDPDALSRPESRVELLVDKVLPAPVLRADLVDDPVLSELEVIRHANATNFTMTPEQASALEARISAGQELAIPELRSSLHEGLFLPPSFLGEVVSMLVEKRQAIFYGPPGTGKTRMAIELATELVRDGGHFDLVQFHPSYAYEDFVGGFRPQEVDGGSGIRYHRVDGPLRRIADQAREAPQFPFILIVDEINRGNVPRIFGELLFLLEYRGRDVRLQYWPEETFSLPANLFLIGTMNTADRSIALVDAALRRRFAFIEFAATKPPIDAVLGNWLERHGLDREPADVLRRLNEAIDEDEFAIGPSYFLNTKGSQPDLGRIWRHEIMPLLEEHFYGTPWDRERFSLERLRSAPDAQA